jgi:hypothetical protein
MVGQPMSVPCPIGNAVYQLRYRMVVVNNKARAGSAPHRLIWRVAHAYATFPDGPRLKQRSRLDQYELWLDARRLGVSDREAQDILLTACGQFGRILAVRALGERLAGGHSALAYVIVEGKQTADAIAEAARTGALTVTGRTVSLVIVSGPFQRTSAACNPETLQPSQPGLSLSQDCL